MAAKQGYVEAQYNLGRVYYLGGMTRSQIARAQELALACVASDYEDCGG